MVVHNDVWLHESHVWGTLCSALTSGSTAGRRSPPTHRKQPGIRYSEVDWLHLLLPKHTGNNVVFKFHIWNLDFIYLLVLTWEKNHCNWNPLIADEVLRTSQRLLILMVFIWAVKDENESTSRRMKNLQWVYRKDHALLVSNNKFSSSK